MRYAVLGGGKRVRPLLAFAAGELADADAGRVSIAAAAVELIHAYSLVHDDLPCMDDDVLRRGRPTCHVEYDEATALLVGDAAGVDPLMGEGISFAFEYGRRAASAASAEPTGAPAAAKPELAIVGDESPVPVTRADPQWGARTHP